MRLAYLDCPSGISGDMLLAGLVAAGAPLAALEEGLRQLPLPPFALRLEEARLAGITALRLTVEETTPPTPRSFSDLLACVEKSGLPARVRETSLRVLRRLGAAEAMVHKETPARLHLHELSGIDTLVDIVGSVLALHILEVDEIACSPLPLARGWVETAHGPLPVPAPATLELLRGVPVYGVEEEGELVTPTGAALAAALASSFGPLPPMLPSAVGYAAGHRSRTRPNVLRVILGEGKEEATGGGRDLPGDEVVQLEALVDDMNPEFYPHLLSSLLSAGALDAYILPAQGKKGRPASLVVALCPPALFLSVSRLLLSESTTLGLRYRPVQRLTLPRQVMEVTVPWGNVRVKVGQLPAGGGEEAVMQISPELEDCRDLALASGRPLKEVYLAAQAAALAALGKSAPEK